MTKCKGLTGSAVKGLIDSYFLFRNLEISKRLLMGTHTYFQHGKHANRMIMGVNNHTEADRQRLEAIIRRGKRTDLCSKDHPTLAELVERADDELFDKILINSGHSCTVFFLVKQFLPMHSGADDIIENLPAKLRI